MQIQLDQSDIDNILRSYILEHYSENLGVSNEDEIGILWDGTDEQHQVVVAKITSKEIGDKDE